MKELDEKAMSYLETRIPELAEGAVKQAYCKNLAAGRKVVEAVMMDMADSCAGVGGLPALGLDVVHMGVLAGLDGLHHAADVDAVRLVRHGRL